MSNSPLTSVTVISPNSSPRYEKIIKITVHHMASVLSAQSCGRIFQNTARQASSNYGIGKDGEIGLYVPEDRQAWTSSSYDNDQRAVTIEVSNSQVGGDWPVSNAAWNSLVNLCVDICKRNGIKRLKWTGDARGTLTCHYMFSATSCPGPYLKARMGKLADEVNSQLSGKVDDLKEIAIPKGGADVFRLYNPYTEKHFFTTSAKEKASLTNAGWKDEGVGWHSPDTGDVVYRMYNPNANAHMWTDSFSEASSLQKAGWVYEGANFASGRSGTPVHRLYNKYTDSHMWTASDGEKDSLVGAGWQYEGTAFYAA